MAYTINANAKNVWIRDNEDTRDLSIQTDASSVYLDNGRTLEQELGEGSMVSNVVTVDGSMSKVIDGTLDGAYESGVMYGRSLVNIHHTVKTMNAKNLQVSGGHIQFDSNGNYTKYGYIYQVKPNTKYIVKVADTNCSMYYRLTSDINSSSGGSCKNNSIITTQDSTTAMCITFEANGGETGKYIKEHMFLEYQDGLESLDLPYFTGICDVKMPILKNIGKNLFDGKLELGGINHNTGALATSKTTKRNVDYITVKPNTQLSFSVNSGESGINWFFYDMNENYISNTFARTVTSPPNAHYLRFYNLVGDIPLNDYQIMIAESTAPVTYEPYKTSILTTPEEVILRKVGDVCDSYDALTGEYVQRIGEVVLDGSEDWIANSTLNTTKTTFFFLPNPHIPSTWWRISAKWSRLPNNRFVSTEDRASAVNQKIEWISGGDGSTGMIQILINTERLSTPDVSGFKQWLSLNPITVHYELETPITTTIEPSTIPFVYENGHIILESGYEGQSLLPTLEYSTVINRTGQIQSIANTVQKQEKQITKLEQMLIQNIVDLDYNNTLLTLGLEINEVI